MVAKKSAKPEQDYACEAHLVEEVQNSINELIELAGLPKIISCHREMVLSKLTLEGRSVPKLVANKYRMLRSDLLLLHENREVTIIEVKVPKTTLELFHGLTQLMLYREVLAPFSGRINCVLVSPTSCEFLYAMIQRCRLDVSIVEWSKRDVLLAKLKEPIHA